ncbi:hypothetical protein Plhal304r1_c035g0108591 [Plasmopara halstedii]
MCWSEQFLSFKFSKALQLVLATEYIIFIGHVSSTWMDSKTHPGMIPDCSFSFDVWMLVLNLLILGATDLRTIHAATSNASTEPA